MGPRPPCGRLDGRADPDHANLQLDLLEDLALGREWQLGYWKHPPLPWWLADLVYRLTGHINAVYVLGPLAAAVCLYGMWLLGARAAGRVRGADRRARAGGTALLQLLGREIRARPDAAAVLGVHRTVLLARHRAWPQARLDPGRHPARGRVLVEIHGLRAGGDARAHSAARSVRAAGLAHARPLPDGAGVCDHAGAACLVADAARLPAVPLSRRPRRAGDAGLRLHQLSAALFRQPMGLSAADAAAAAAAVHPGLAHTSGPLADDTARFNRRYVTALGTRSLPSNDDRCDRAGPPAARHLGLSVLDLRAARHPDLAATATGAVCICAGSPPAP